MQISVLTPDQEVFSGDIKSLNVPGIGGQFEILNNHAPIVSALGNGSVKLVKDDGQVLEFNIEKGFVEVLYNKISLLVAGYEAKS